MTRFGTQLLFASSCPAISVLLTTLTYGIQSPIEVGDLHPELRHLDSAYVPGRGFPLAWWIVADPFSQGGTPKSRFILETFIGDAALFSMLTAPIWAFVWLVLWFRSRRLRFLEAERASTGK